MNADKDFVFEYIREYMGAAPEYLWDGLPDAAAFRHSENKKWFALYMNISADKLDPKRSGRVDIMNVKCDPLIMGTFLLKDGFFPAYHMNKKHWLTVLLDGTVSADEAVELVCQSFELTAGGIKKKK